MTQILIIDDDVELAELVMEFMRREGISAQNVQSGEEGVQQALSGHYAAVVLDVMLPGIGGFEVLRQIRAAQGARAHIPVLMLTARGDEIDRVLGLEQGADDYLSKPFSTRELVARLRAILRRSVPIQDRGSSAEEAAGAKAETMEIDGVRLDPAAREVSCGGNVVELTAVEFGLLEVLMRSAGEVVSRETMAQSVLGRSLSPYDRSIDTHLSNLRRKLGTQNGAERIKTIRSAGYIFTRSSNRDEG